jgi:nucleotide-binding universal stress UspA family protein
MKKVLVPTDFSDGSFNALIHALHAAKIMNSSVEVIHAYSMPPTGSNVMVDITDVLKKNAEEEMEEFKERVERLSISSGVDIAYGTSYGSVVDVINRMAKESEVSAVIMGTQGASGITEKWLGSNTAAAARNVKVPLIAIPAEKPYAPLEKILFSTDMKVMKNADYLDFVAEFSKLHNASVKFFHVRTPEDDADESAYKKQVEDHFGIEPTFSFTYNDDVEKGIEKAIGNERPSLLVVVRHDYGFFESLFHSSVSSHIINNASLPILVLNG